MQVFAVVIKQFFCYKANPEKQTYSFIRLFHNQDTAYQYMSQTLKDASLEPSLKEMVYLLLDQNKLLQAVKLVNRYSSTIDDYMKIQMDFYISKLEGCIWE